MRHLLLKFLIVKPNKDEIHTKIVCCKINCVLIDNFFPFKHVNYFYKVYFDCDIYVCIPVTLCCMLVQMCISEFNQPPSIQ